MRLTKGVQSSWLVLSIDILLPLSHQEIAIVPAYQEVAKHSQYQQRYKRSDNKVHKNIHICTSFKQKVHELLTQYAIKVRDSTRVVQRHTG